MSGAYATKENCSAHAYRRAKERLQLPDNFNFQRFCDCLLRKIRRGEAKCVQLAHEGRLIYDVAGMPLVNPDVVRVVVNEEKDFVISVIPPTNGVERAKQSKKDAAEAKGKRRREFYRSLRIEGDDNEDQMD